MLEFCRDHKECFGAESRTREHIHRENSPTCLFGRVVTILVSSSGSSRFGMLARVSLRGYGLRLASQRGFGTMQAPMSETQRRDLHRGKRCSECQEWSRYAPPSQSLGLALQWLAAEWLTPCQANDHFI